LAIGTPDFLNREGIQTAKIPGIAPQCLVSIKIITGEQITFQRLYTCRRSIDTGWRGWCAKSPTFAYPWSFIGIMHKGCTTPDTDKINLRCRPLPQYTRCNQRGRSK